LTTTDPTQMYSNFNSDVAQYNSDVAHGVTRSPTMAVTDSAGDTVTLDFAPGNSQPARLEFGFNQATDFFSKNQSTSGVYQLVRNNTDYGTIDASFDAAKQQVVVDPAEVQGGFIQLYGQILNTSNT